MINETNYERLMHDLDELDRQDKQAKAEDFKDRFDKKVQNMLKKFLPKDETTTAEDKLKKP